MTLLAAAMAASAMSEITNTVKVTKFHQSYPYSGKATVEYTVDGTLPDNAVAEIILNTDDASATFTQKGIVTGANSHVIDFSSSFGGALLLTNASFVVTIAEDIGGVQLWENGPYWAECNVGATKPEEYGYYFWWGDTAGYSRKGGTLTHEPHSPDSYVIYSGVTWVSSVAEQMSNSPFTSSSCPTSCKDNSELLSAGYIDSTGNLAAAHDAATAYLGVPWRMPTRDEADALVNNCTTTWITTNGVNGRLITGTGDYVHRSIFFPAAGFGGEYYEDTACFFYPGFVGDYWTATPMPDDLYFNFAMRFSIDSSEITFCHFCNRCGGLSVRPVRDLTECKAVGIVTYDPVPVPPTVTDVVAKQRFPWKGLVDITCKVSGIEGTSNRLWFAVSAVMPDSGDVSESRHFWVVRDGANSTDYAVHTNGSYRLLWDSNADLGDVRCSNMVMRVTFTTHNKVQLWKGGPYWADANIGAEKPEDYGYYFWWGDTVGYKRKNDAWVASDASNSNFSFDSGNTPTWRKSNSTLQDEGWITSEGVLSPAHDAAYIHWGGRWRMPTMQELDDLQSNCEWTWSNNNGVDGYVVRGKGEFSSSSIFLPEAGWGESDGLSTIGCGYYWSSVPSARYDSRYAWGLNLYYSSQHSTDYSSHRYYGQTIRPVQGFVQ